MSRVIAVVIDGGSGSGLCGHSCNHSSGGTGVANSVVVTNSINSMSSGFQSWSTGLDFDCRTGSSSRSIGSLVASSVGSVVR